jgi:hypothetical protein
MHWYMATTRPHSRCRADTHPRQVGMIPLADKTHPAHSVQPSQSIHEHQRPHTQLCTHSMSRYSPRSEDINPRQADTIPPADMLCHDHLEHSPLSIHEHQRPHTQLCTHSILHYSPHSEDTNPRQAGMSSHADMVRPDHSGQLPLSTREHPQPHIHSCSRSSCPRSQHSKGTHPHLPDTTKQLGTISPLRSATQSHARLAQSLFRKHSCSLTMSRRSRCSKDTRPRQRGKMMGVDMLHPSHSDSRSRSRSARWPTRTDRCTAPSCHHSRCSKDTYPRQVGRLGPLTGMMHRVHSQG